MLSITDPDARASATLFLISEAEMQDPNSSYLTYDVSDSIIGTATFSQSGSIVTLEIRLENQVVGASHAVHIHQGTITKPERHWNRGELSSFCNARSMGQLWAKPFAGDVGNISIDSEGNGFFSMQTDLWAINSQDSTSILNTIIVIHEKEEDFAMECTPGHTHMHDNKKVAAGVIEKLEEASL